MGRGKFDEDFESFFYIAVFDFNVLPLVGED